MGMDDIQLVTLRNLQSIRKTCIGYPAVLKGKEGHRWEADNIPILIAVDILIRSGKDKNGMSQFFQLSL